MLQLCYDGIQIALFIPPSRHRHPDPCLEIGYRVTFIPSNSLHRIPMLDNTRPLEPELIHHRTICPIQTHLVVEDPISLTGEPLDVADR